MSFIKVCPDAFLYYFICRLEQEMCNTDPFVPRPPPFCSEQLSQAHITLTVACYAPTSVRCAHCDRSRPFSHEETDGAKKGVIQ